MLTVADVATRLAVGITAAEVKALGEAGDYDPRTATR